MESLLESPIASDPLNDFGLALLSTDYRYIGLTTLLIALILVGVKYARVRKFPSFTDTAAGILSLISIYSSVVVGSIFLLTKPPAIERLEGIELAVVGLISFVFLFFLGAYQAYVSFLKK